MITLPLVMPAAITAEPGYRGRPRAAASLDAVASFYALIHLPLGDQRVLFPRIRAGLRPVWDRFVPEGDSGHSLILARSVPVA